LGSHVLTDKAGLSAIRKQVRTDLSRTDIDASTAFDCLVAVTEACTQALAHADLQTGRHPQISWEINATEALFYIQDYSSQEWSRASHPSTPLSTREGDLEQRLESLGLQLMRGLMDDVRIDMQNSGTTVILVKSLNHSSFA
jgi:anti-sigma regulatory factor (Ser/Thr protein kinase)